jgi:hypothetical protein
MGATSWQHIRTFSGDVDRTLDQLRRDVFASRAFYLADEPALVATSGDGSTVACLDRPSSIEDALRWNGDEGTHSVLDITEGVAMHASPHAVSALEPDAMRRSFGSVHPTLFEVLMTDFDAADVCEPGGAGYFVIAEPGEPALVVFVGCTGT